MMTTHHFQKHGGEDMNELELLREAGLTLYQSKVYAALKSENGLRPIEIVHRSGIPQSKIHETLYSLENLGLVKRQLNNEGAAQVNKLINQFLTQTKSHKISVRVYGKGRIRQVWSTNGVSLTSLVDARIRELERTKRRIARYEALTTS
jgi:DNA-binding MarR family transcriptional regulator